MGSIRNLGRVQSRMQWLVGPLLGTKRKTRGHNGCLPFTRRNRLVDSCSKWDASNPDWKFPQGCARSISTTHSRKIGSETIQAKRPGTSKNLHLKRTFSIRKFRSGMLVYLTRNPVFPRKFPFGETKLISPFTFYRKFPDFLG